MRLGRILAAIVIAALMSPFASAATLVEWSMEGVIHTPAPESVPASTVAQGLTALDVTRGPGIASMSLNNGFSAEGWDDAQTRADALKVGAYFQFGFIVNNGYTASLSTLDLALRRSAASAPMNFEVQVSLDDFQTPGITVANFNYFGRTSGSAPASNPLAGDPYYYMTFDLPGRPNETTSPGDPVPTIDLSKVPQLQNLPGGTRVTIRLYAWGDGRVTPTNTVALGRMIGPKIGGTVTAQ